MRKEEDKQIISKYSKVGGNTKKVGAKTKKAGAKTKKGNCEQPPSKKK